MMKRLCEVCRHYFYQPYGWSAGHFFLCMYGGDDSPMKRDWQDVTMLEPEACSEYKGVAGVDELREAGRLMQGG